VQHDLDALVIDTSINDLAWLRSRHLRQLAAGEFTGVSLAALKRLKNLTSLTLRLRTPKSPI
jgi:hypothetical protein